MLDREVTKRNKLRGEVLIYSLLFCSVMPPISWSVIHV